ncbi:MAG TPA: hypothetical protein VH008_29510 [Pseudonocardia sp.]|jgi:hypothetical protein|nr:hypothetical protein [Pseudonocardia sp.]
MTEPTDRVTPIAGFPETPGDPGAPTIPANPEGEPPAGFPVPRPRTENDWAAQPNPAASPYPYAALPPYPVGQPYPNPAGMGAPWGWPAPPVPKPGVIPLRRLGVGEILDGAISYIRANPAVTLGLSAVMITITQLFQVPAAALNFRGLTPPRHGAGGLALFEQMAQASSIGLTTILAWIVSFVATTMLTGMLIVVLSRAVLGERPSFGEVWAVVRHRLLGLIGLALLSGLAYVGVVVVAMVPLVVALVAGAPTGLAVLLGVGGFLAAFCLGLWLLISWSLAAPAYILEDVSVPGALGRSFRLVRRQWWRVFGILALGFLITFVLAAILVVPFSIGGGVLAATTGLASGGGNMLPVLAITAVGTIIASTITAPFRAGVVGLVYFDQRIRREGLDLELAQATETGSGWGAVTPGRV